MPRSFESYWHDAHAAVNADEVLLTDPVLRTVWLGTELDGQLRNGGWAQATFNLDRKGVSFETSTVVVCCSSCATLAPPSRSSR